MDFPASLTLFPDIEAIFQAVPFFAEQPMRSLELHAKSGQWVHNLAKVFGWTWCHSETVPERRPG